MSTIATPARRITILGAGVLLAASVASTLAVGGPASAFTVLPETQPGGPVYVPAPMISAVGEDRPSAGLQVAPLTVWHLDEGDGSETSQTVVVEYTLQRHDSFDVWTKVDTGQVQVSTDPGGSGVAPGWTFERPATSTREEYRVEAKVSWIDQQTNYLLGVTTIVPSLWGDVRCETDPVAVACAPTETGGISF
jgi:hypothetical protein